jgi:hypothetical protein
MVGGTGVDAGKLVRLSQFHKERRGNMALDLTPQWAKDAEAKWASVTKIWDLFVVYIWGFPTFISGNVLVHTKDWPLATPGVLGILIMIFTGILWFGWFEAKVWSKVKGPGGLLALGLSILWYYDQLYEAIKAFSNASLLVSLPFLAITTAICAPDLYKKGKEIKDKGLGGVFSFLKFSKDTTAKAASLVVRGSRKAGKAFAKLNDDAPLVKETRVALETLHTIYVVDRHDDAGFLRNAEDLEVKLKAKFPKEIDTIAKVVAEFKEKNSLTNVAPEDIRVAALAEQIRCRLE